MHVILRSLAVALGREMGLGEVTVLMAARLTVRMTGEASGLTEPAFRRRPLSEGGPGKNSSASVMNVSSHFTPCWPVSSF